MKIVYTAEDPNWIGASVRDGKVEKYGPGWNQVVAVDGGPDVVMIPKNKSMSEMFPLKYYSVDVEFRPSMFKYHPVWGAAWGYMTPEQMAEWEKWVQKQQAMGNLQGVSDPLPEVKPHPLEPQPVKKCTCGAHSCGHNGHSNWCDLA